MNTTVRDTLLEITVDDITTLDVGAVVSPTDETVSMTDGVAAALRAAGGDELETLARAQGPIQVGDAVATPGGRLGAKWVVHVAVRGPQITPDANLIAQVTRRAIQVADKVGARSVALPLFGAGADAVPLYSAASIMVGAARAYLESTTHTGLRKVVFWAPGAAAKAAFGNALVGSIRL